MEGGAIIVAHEPIEADYKVKGEGVATEPLRAALLDALQSDPLYLRLQELRLADKVLAPEILAGLTPGMHYGTPDLPALIGATNVPESTVRTWVDRFTDYVQPVRDGRNYRFTLAAVIRVRVLYILIKQLRWQFATVRNVLAGLVEDADLVEEGGQGETRDIVAMLESIAPKGADYRAVDPRVLYLITQLVDVEASANAGRLVLSREAIPGDVREQIERIPHLENENRRLQGELEEARREIEANRDESGSLQARLETAEGQLKGWAAIPVEEIQGLLDRQRKGFFARLFGGR